MGIKPEHRKIILYGYTKVTSFRFNEHGNYQSECYENAHLPHTLSLSADTSQNCIT